MKTICPRGFFCPNGTGHTWHACPPGTYGNTSGLSEERECTPCDPGKFCRGSNLTAPDGECWEGYYCSRGAAVPDPIMTNLTYCPARFVHLTVGDICPRGHFCPKGSSMYKGMLINLIFLSHPIQHIVGHFCSRFFTVAKQYYEKSSVLVLR